MNWELFCGNSYLCGITSNTGYYVFCSQVKIPQEPQSPSKRKAWNSEDVTRFFHRLSDPYGMMVNAASPYFGSGDAVSEKKNVAQETKVDAPQPCHHHHFGEKIMRTCNPKP